MEIEFRIESGLQMDLNESGLLLDWNESGLLLDWNESGLQLDWNECGLKIGLKWKWIATRLKIEMKVDGNWIESGLLLDWNWIENGLKVDVREDKTRSRSFSLSPPTIFLSNFSFQPMPQKMKMMAFIENWNHHCRTLFSLFLDNGYICLWGFKMTAFQAGSVVLHVGCLQLLQSIN